MVKINRILDNRKLKNIEYYKLRQKFMTNCDSLFIANCDRFLLQIATAFLSQIARKLLQIVTDITNCDKIITNCDRTKGTCLSFTQ